MFKPVSTDYRNPTKRKDEYLNTIDITDEVSLSKEETIKLAFRFKSVTLFPLPRNVA
jgi:hypothetical protein